MSLLQEETFMSGSEKPRVKFNSIDTLKKKLNPKPRGNIVELNKIDLATLTEREKLMLRVINDLEEQLDES
jgi:predicted transcriptional regulator